MSHWFTGWKFWPDRPQGPVGSAYRQVKWIRPYRPGPLRILVTGIGLFITVLPALLAMGAVLTPGPILARFTYMLIFGLPAAGLAILVTRFLAVGVYVNDAGVRIMTMRHVTVFPWRLVTDVSNRSRRGEADTEGDLVVITVRDSGPIATPVRRVGPDFLGRAEAFTMASMAIERWWRDASAMGRARG
jgi:hypothetical protein